MRYKFLFTLTVGVLILHEDVYARRTSGRSRGSSSRGQSVRRTHVSPTATSYSGHQFGQSKQHSYPSSHTGLSGNSGWSVQRTNVGQQHSYPANTQQHTYPSKNQQNSYPSGNQQHSYPSGNQQHSYPSGNQQHSYPSGNQQHSYPASSSGLSGHGGSKLPPYSPSAPGYPSNHGSYPTNTNYHQQAPPPYNSGYNNYQHGPPSGSYSPGYHPSYHPSYGQHGGFNGGYGGYSPQGFGSYGKGVGSRSGLLTGLGIAGASVGTVLSGLALWNLARSSGRHSQPSTYIYNDNRGLPVHTMNGSTVPGGVAPPVEDPILKELLNCSLTIQSSNGSEVLGIPCSIATSFSPNSESKDTNIPTGSADETRCIIALLLRNGTEFSTTIPCSKLISTAAEANVTEPPPFLTNNSTNETYPIPGQYPGMYPPPGLYPGMNPPPGQGYYPPTTNVNGTFNPSFYPGYYPYPYYNPGYYPPNGTGFPGPGFYPQNPYAPPYLNPGEDPNMNGTSLYPSAGNISSTADINSSSLLPNCLEGGAKEDPLSPCYKTTTHSLDVIPINSSTPVAA